MSIRRSRSIFTKQMMDMQLSARSLELASDITLVDKCRERVSLRSDLMEHMTSLRHGEWTARDLCFG